MEKLRLFNENELELLISGLPTIDFADWKEHTKYTGYTNSSIQISWFWEIVREMREEDRALLLKFTCGTSSVPVVSELFFRRLIVKGRIFELESPLFDCEAV
jgi:E3 ubiquitin-protein ligase HUWE1